MTSLPCPSTPALGRDILPLAQNPEIHSPDPEISEIRSGFELKFFSFFFSWKMCLSLHLFWLHHRKIRTLSGCPRISGHAVIFELLRWTGKRSPAATNELRSTLSIKVVSSVPFPPLPVAADPGRFFHMHPLLSLNDILHLADTVWA